jgi:predicted GIY-YIG superfamily endonuclease
VILDQTMYYPYQPVDVILPLPGTWSVYMIASLKDTRVTYIKLTRNLRRRLNTHNKGKGSTMTNSPAYLPWGLIGYVVGFGDFTSHLSLTLQFERRLYEKKQAKQKQNRGMLGCAGIADIGQRLVKQWNEDMEMKQFIYVICGKVQRNKTKKRLVEQWKENMEIKQFTIMLHFSFSRRTTFSLSFESTMG